MLNSRIWMTLKSSVVIFQALEPLQPLWPHWPHQPLQPHFIKELPDSNGWIISGTKMTFTFPFLWNGSSKIQFFNDMYFIYFLSEAVEACWCYFFENWLIKLQCPNLLKPLGTIIQENYWSFYPSEPFRILRSNMRHPVISVKNN